MTPVESDEDSIPRIGAEHLTTYDRIDMILESPHIKQEFFHIRPANRVLGTASVAAITYFYGCGGPLGSETIVESAGPLVGMVSLIVYPLLITIPYAAIVAELCSAFPEDGGFTVWVLNGFGSFWGFQIGYWSWIAGIINGAIYPSLLLDLFTQYTDTEIRSSTMRFLIKASIGIVLAIPTLLGTKAMGRAAIVNLVCVLLPLCIYTVWAYVEAKDVHDLLEIRHETNTLDETTQDVVFEGGYDVDWTVLINTLFWNFDGINMASVFGGQVLNPARVYSRAIWVTVGLTIATYFLPIPATIASNALSWIEFERGSYGIAAKHIGGTGLELVMLVSTVGTNVGLYVSSMFCKSFEMAGMADHNMLPPIFAKRNEAFGSPHFAAIATLVPTVALVGIDFDVLLPVTNAFAALVALLTILTSIQLRRNLPYIPRPVKVPGGTWGLALLAVFPTGVFGFIMVHACSDLTSILLVLGFLVPGLCYGGYQSYKRTTIIY
ncbi:Amino acid-polyamine-organocation, partial [Globisporangium splendens]